jgi:hypothetical protein
MTTFYDKRAERQVAAGIARQHEAEAAARQAETELRLLDVAERRDQLDDQRVKRAAERSRTARRERAEWISRAHTRLASVGPVLVGTVAMGAPILIGWNGQLQTARAVLHLGALSWAFPVAMEGGVWWLAYLIGRAIRHGLPTGRLRASLWILALVAAGMNFWHGVLAYGLLGGTGLALASLLGIVLWEVTAWHHRHHVAGRTAAEVRTAWLRRLRFPRLALAAASIAVAYGPTADRDASWRAAWIDRYGVGPEATRRDRRLARFIVRQQWRADREAAERGELTIVSGVILRVGPARLQSVQTEASNTPIEKPKLSGRAAEVFQRTCVAIEAGDLPEAPSASAIRRRFKIGMETAIAVRNALTLTEREEVA